jgi:PAS domain S-box-containing protein
LCDDTHRNGYLYFLQIVNSQETYRAIFDQAPVGMAHLSPELHWLDVNRRLCEMTGYSHDELLSVGWQNITPQEDLPFNLEGLAKLSTGDLDRYSAEKRYICKDGRIIWVKISVSPVRDVTDQHLLYFVTVIEEITEYKRAQELRLQAEEKFTKAFRQTPTPTILVRMKDDRYLEVNEAFERFSGFSREEAVGRTPYDLNLWVDLARRQELIEAVRAGECVQGWENGFRTKDGRLRTVLTFAEQIEIDGERCILWAAMDITDRKRLESELGELTGRLIKAQDEERKRIAAELNDSLGQSLTVVSFEICRLARSAKGELGRDLQSLCAKIQDIASGIGILSQTLHPSGLDYTGLPWAIEGLCRQFTHAYDLQISFKHEGVPSSLPPDVALCVYRIIQEALSNVVEHSGTRHAWIQLVCEGQSIHLDLWDKGVGFQTDSARAGLGLLTMRERCRRLNGWLVIHNGRGTRIEAHIPLPDAEMDLFNPAVETVSGAEQPE